MRCDLFDGFPCLADGKVDAHVRCVRPALRHGNVALLTHARADRLVTDASGHRVTGVVVDHRGTQKTYRGDIVVGVLCGAVNSAALLLKVGRRPAPERAGECLRRGGGRHYMAHINSGVVAISQQPNPTRFQKTLGINDFYWDADGSGFPLGHIQMLGKSDRHILRGGAPWFAPGPALQYLATHAIDFGDDRGPALPWRTG